MAKPIKLQGENLQYFDDNAGGSIEFQEDEFVTPRDYIRKYEDRNGNIYWECFKRTKVEKEETQ